MGARRAAVTGATGFLGLHIVRALAAAGWQVRVLARQPSVDPELRNPMIDTVVGDLSNQRALRELVDGAEIVVHAAGLVKAASLAAFRAVNVGGSANLVAAVNDCSSAKHLLLVSSIAAREPSLSPYATTKREGEEIVVTTLQPSRGWTIVRPCVVYGPGDKMTLAMFRAASRRIIPLLGPQNGRLAMIHAADAAGAIARLGGLGPAGRVFELTDPRIEGYAWREIVAALETAIGTTVLPLPLPGPVVCAAAVVNMIAARVVGRTPIFTLGKAREILHADWGSATDRLPPPAVWRPAIALIEGFRDTVSWYRERRWLPRAADALS